MNGTLQRISKAEAARRLGVSDRQLDRLKNRGIFSTQKDSDSKQAAVYFLSDEIDLYMEENAKGEGRGAAAVRAHRIKMKRVKR